MNRIPVSSSNLASVGYDPQTNTLEIEFHSGSIYQYFNVPQSIYDGLMGAGSHGRYFDAHIKKAGYPYRRIR
ncbi:MAG: KTSC domain-containing protein [Acidobacteriota bacterium]